VAHKLFHVRYRHFIGVSKFFIGCYRFFIDFYRFFIGFLRFVYKIPIKTF